MIDGLLLLMLVGVVIVTVTVYRSFETPLRVISAFTDKLKSIVAAVLHSSSEKTTQTASTHGLQLIQIYRGECSKCHRVFYGTNQDTDDGVKLFERTLNGKTINVCSSCSKIIDEAFTKQTQSGITDCSDTVRDMLGAANAKKAEDTDVPKHSGAKSPKNK